MIRTWFGNKLPPDDEGRVGDRFYNTEENIEYVFDDGSWMPAPQHDTQLPVPAPDDYGKFIAANYDGTYVLSNDFGILYLDEKYFKFGNTIVPESALASVKGDVTVEFDFNEMTSSMTAGEIVEAYRAGKTVIAKNIIGGGLHNESIYPLIFVSWSRFSYTVEFLSPSSNTTIQVDNLGELHLSPLTPEIPDPSAADAGKAIVVGGDGAYELAFTGANVVHCRERDGELPNPYSMEIGNPISAFSNIKVDRGIDGEELSGNDVWYGCAMTGSIRLYSALPAVAESFVSPNGTGTPLSVLPYADVAALSNRWARCYNVCGIHKDGGSPQLYMMAEDVFVDMNTSKLYVPVGD